jgi:hypothetical protein
MRTQRAAHGRCTYCGLAECYDAWDLLPLLPKDLIKARCGCLKDVLKGHPRTKPLLEEHGWPGVLEHITNEQLAYWFPPLNRFGAPNRNVKDAAEWLAKNPNSDAAQFLQFASAIQDPEFLKKGRDYRNEMPVQMGEQPTLSPLTMSEAIAVGKRITEFIANKEKK